MARRVDVNVRASGRASPATSTSRPTSPGCSAQRAGGALRLSRALRSPSPIGCSRIAATGGAMTSSGIRQRARGRRRAARRLSSRRGDGARRMRRSRPRSRAVAEQLCLAGHGTHVSFSKKVFIPLTQAVPGRLPLLHVRARAPRGRAALPLARGGARHRARGAGGRLQGGAVHAGRPAGAALRGGARGACARSAPSRRSHYLESVGRAGAEGDRPAAAPQSRRDGRGLARAPAQGVGVAGHHAGDGVGAAVASAAARTSARPTRCRPCASPRWRPQAARACPSPPAS